MSHRRIGFLLAGGWILAGILLAHPVPGRAIVVITVSDPWVRVAPNGKSAEAFMEIRSSERATVVGAESEISAEVPMQQPGTKRATTSGIALPAGARVKLAPGAYRFLLPMLNRSLKLGDRIAMDLIVEGADGSRQTIPVNAEVRRRSAYDDHMRARSHAH